MKTKDACVVRGTRLSSEDRSLERLKRKQVKERNEHLHLLGIYEKIVKRLTTPGQIQLLLFYHHKVLKSPHGWREQAV